MSEQHPAVMFLLAAHERAEGQARAAASDSGGEEWDDCGRLGEDVMVKDSNCYVACGPWDCPLSDGIRYHVALHDPASVLARVAAEREILAEHNLDEGRYCRRCAKWLDLPISQQVEPDDAVDWPCRTVLGLAKAWGWEMEA